MKLGFVLAPLLVSSVAYAQAPGDYYEEGSGAPGITPVVVAPTPPPPKPRRWSVGLGIGSVNLAPHVAPENETEFSVGQLAVRYRMTRHLELELAFAGGREQVHDEYEGKREGDREVSQAVLGLRYRFNPQRKWNLWVMAGLGSLAVTHHEASDEERDYAQQSTLQFGAGLERRWSRFALQLELRAVGVAPHEREGFDDAPVVTEPTRPGMETPLPPEQDMTTYANDGMSGGQVILSGNYYF